MTYAELKKRGDALAAGWQRCLSAPATDALLEFAVAISSFTEFLHGNGLSGLQQMARSLEQQTLALLNGASGPPGQAALAALDLRLQELVQRVSDYIDAQDLPLIERRAQAQVPPSPADIARRHRLWLIGPHAPPWQELARQLKHFGIDVEFHLADDVPAAAQEPAVVLLDAQELTLEQASQQIRALRQRFSASTLMAGRLPPDFESLRSALGAGCDCCFDSATPLAALMARILDLSRKEQEEPYRALVVEDSLSASTSIQRTLAMIDVETLVISRPQGVLEHLAQFQPDLILMDMAMPGCTGIEAARVIRQHPEFLSIPIVYLSGDANISMQVEALRLGGDHFLTKPYNPVVLNAVVQSKIERYRILRRAMQRDGLTGLYNHSSVKEKLAAALQQAADAQQPLSVVMIDIDHFKDINDSYGHPMGDQVIRNLAWFVRQHLRHTDLIGRYGGEEFLVVLPSADARQAVALLDRIRRDFGQIKHPFNETWCRATVSVGITELHEGATAELLIKQADEALYAAKRAGRNRVVQAASP